MADPVAAHDFPEIRWHGHWIWVPEEPLTPAGFWSAGVDPHAPEAHGLFRKQFDLAHVLERVPARITADSRYALFVNGREVSRGPIRSQPRRLHYDMLDLAPYLQTGQNMVAVYVKYYGTPQSFWMPAVPNTTLGRRGVLVFEANLGDSGWLTSDSTWRALKSEAWTDDGRKGLGHGGGVPVEVFDARRLPHDWQSLDFDDAGWGLAQQVAPAHIGAFGRSQPPSDPYGALFPRPIAALGGQLRGAKHVQLDLLASWQSHALPSPIARVQAAASLPILAATTVNGFPIELTIPEQGAARLSLDMGAVVSGLVTFALDAPAGTVLDISYTEDPFQPSFSMDKMSAGTRYIARGAHDRFQVFDSNGFRFAYLLVHGASGPVTLTGFGVREQHYPWAAGASFRCSDDQLNAIFQAGLRTVQLCSHDAFIDCPTREQRAWVGDGVVHQMVHLATNCDWRLAQHFLTLGNSPRADGLLPMTVVGDIEASGVYTIPDWSLHWLHALHNLYRFTGDREAVAACLPTARRILAWYCPYQTSTGVLKDVPEWNLVDWSAVSVADTSAVLTALWARGLREFAELAGWLDERGSQRWAEGLYTTAREGFEIFWDERRGTYVDHVVDGQRRPEISQLAGALAIVSGLAPEARWQRIARTITDPQLVVVRSWLGTGTGEQSMEKWKRQANQGIYEITWDVEHQIVLAEPFMSYVVHDAVAQAGCAELLPDLCRRWAQFLAGGYNTLGECWDFGTHVHGWSCTPTRDMVFYTLGVSPAEPGYAKARIAPRLGPLDWARGRVPTPYGLIDVEVSAGRLTVESPVRLIIDLAGRLPVDLPAGRHVLGGGMENLHD